MSFAAPIWLWALAPWAVLAAWMFTGLRPRADVSFLELWRGPVRGPKPKRTFTPPPVAILCALLALLAAILAAAGPLIRSDVALPVTIIVDRGVTMSARGKTDARWRELVDAVSKTLLEQSGHGFVDVILMPGAGAVREDRAQWARIRSEPSTSIRTGELLAAAARNTLSQSGAPVLILTDQTLEFRDPRLVQIAPPSRPKNVDIAALAARDSPRPQVMVRIRNQSPTTQATLTVKSDNAIETKPIGLAASGTERAEFIDLPSFATVIEVSVEAPDDLPADNTAWLVRQRAWPSIEVRDAIPDQLERMIRVYGKNRPASEGSSKRVVVVSDISQLAPNEARVICERHTEAYRPVEGPLRVVSHPVTTSVNWNEVLKDARTSLHVPDGSWAPLITSGSDVLLAARESPARQVWVGFDSPQMPRTADYVVFWTNIFDWLGEGGGEAFESEPIAELAAGWHRIQPQQVAPGEALVPQPGVYRRDDGALRAMNLIDVKFPDRPAGAIDSPGLFNGRKLAGARDMTAPFAIAAIVLLALGALLLASQKPLHWHTV